jgi:hypothetical protein
MSTCRLVLIERGLDARSLAEAFSRFDITLSVFEQGFRHGGAFDDVHAVEMLTRHGPYDGLLLAPAIADGAADAPLDDVVDVLTSSFIYLKAALASFEDRAVAGRVIALLPGDATMGDPGDVVNSAIAGAMLSLFRTVALELRRTSITANTLMYSADETAGLATLINSLLDPDAHSINGQEIYACGGADVGRLHP